MAQIGRMSRYYDRQRSQGVVRVALMVPEGTREDCVGLAAFLRRDDATGKEAARRLNRLIETLTELDTKNAEDGNAANRTRKPKWLEAKRSGEVASRQQLRKAQSLLEELQAAGDAPNVPDYVFDDKALMIHLIADLDTRVAAFKKNGE